MHKTGFLGLVSVLQEKYPGYRLGQIIDNLAGEDDLFYLSNDELTKRASMVIAGGWEESDQWK